jgi:hypothetical protein
LNAAESEAMRMLAGGQDDLVIVNSCAVTNEAVRQTRQAIRKAKRARPDARIFVTGCAAQVEPETFAAMPEVARVLGNREKFEASNFTPPVRAEPVEAQPFPLAEDEGRNGLRQAQAERGLGFGRVARRSCSASGGAGDGAASDCRPRREVTRCRGAEWLRPSLHLPYHPHGRGGKPAGAAGLVIGPDQGAGRRVIARWC